ncbi:MAG: hypothetical protein CVV52_13120, partial [Spirochaetae bacterium HGW-Spirochaetae-8]
DLKSTLYVLLAIAVGIAAFLELYKKGIRKDKAKELEIWLVAWVLSVVFSSVAYVSFHLQGSPFAIILYSAGVYICQYYFDMKLIKKVVKAWAKSKGITLEGFKHDE